MNLKIKPDTIKEMEELRSKGLSFHAIGERVGLNECTVARTLKSESKRYRVSEEDISLMRELKEQGWKHGQIAERIGCSPTTVTIHLKGYLSNRQHQKKGIIDNNHGRPESQINWTWADWQKYWNQKKS